VVTYRSLFPPFAALAAQKESSSYVIVCTRARQTRGVEALESTKRKDSR